MAINWKSLTTTKEVDEIIQQSHQKPQLIFKHSTSCGISAHVKMQFESEWLLEDDTVDTHYLDLLTYRSVSNYITEVSGVYHQSPQVILFKDGGVLANASHRAIKANTINDVLV